MNQQFMKKLKSLLSGIDHCCAKYDPKYINFIFRCLRKKPVSEIMSMDIRYIFKIKFRSKTSSLFLVVSS